MDVLALTTYDEAPFMNQQFDALERRGVDVHSLTVPGHVSAGDSRRPQDYLRFFPRVIREARGEYDLVHAHYGLTAPMALAQFRLPVVLSLWGSDLNGPARGLSKVCAPFCDEVIVMTERMRRTLGRECSVVPFGVDLDLFRPTDPATARARVGWDDDRYHVLFPYSPERTVKNYPLAERVVDAVDASLDRRVTLHVVHGIDHERVPTYMNAADALLLTSHNEGSPMSVKEALACNLPVVSRDVGDAPRRLTGVEPSRVVGDDDDLAPALRAVLERAERSNGRRAAREVSQETTIERVLEVYGRALGRPVGDLDAVEEPRSSALDD